MLIKKENNDFDLSPVIDFFRTAKDGNWFVECSQKKPSRSSKQNRYYHGVVVDILSKETGYSNHDIKLVLQEKFLGYEEKTVGKTYIKTLKSSADLKVDEMEIYLTNIRSWANDFGWIIPLPNEY